MSVHKIHIISLLLQLFFVQSFVSGNERQIRTLFYSLEKNSLPQQLAFYELYPNTPEGTKALSKAWELLSGTTLIDGKLVDLPITASSIEGMVKLVNKQPSEDITVLTNQQLQIIEAVSNKLSNRKLQGYYATNERQILDLPSSEIDVARAVLISQMDDNIVMQKIRSYEAMIDLMALQIMAKLPENATPEQKIRTINAFIFEEMGFRFPPHSKHVKDIDFYTFLPSVIDSRLGVCLGVSILYISIAQRLDLPLEVITPPGHIYIRYNNGRSCINIETTARGIHVDSEEYLGIRCRKLQERNIKEVIGMAHINNAGVCLKEERYEEALKRYHKALPYLPGDKQLSELMGYCYLFIGETDKGEALLREFIDYLPEEAVNKSTLAEDYFLGKTGVDAIRAVFLHVDETRDSILKKKDALIQALAKYPEFREGWESLATTWIQLHRTKEALQALEKCHSLDSEDSTVEYYLSAIYGTRFNYPKAWEHLKAAEELVAKRNHSPKALKYLRRQLAMVNPE
jgi:tetratricopeptide (TPR) repeat protein